MAYYAAVISLKQTILHLLSYPSQISILPSSQCFIFPAYKEVFSLQEFLQRLEKDVHGSGGRSSSSSEKVNALKAQIRKAAWKLEDAIDSLVSNQFLISQSKSLGDDIHEGSSISSSILDLEELKHEIHSFTETVKKTEKMMLEELSKPLPEDQDDDAVSSRIHHFDGKMSKMVGLSHEFMTINDLLAYGWPDLQIVSLVGMAGIGKSTLAKKIYENPSLMNYCDCRLWVTIGPKYHLKRVLLDMLAQMNHDVDKIRMGEEKKLAEYLRRSLNGRTYIVVVDDIWSTKDWDKLKRILPDDCHRSRVLLTTRLQKVAQYASNANTNYMPSQIHQMPFLNKEESWYLLRDKVFGEGNWCPPQLEKSGKKIAKKCEGLPLTIITVAGLLSEAEKTPEYWTKVAEEKENSLFTDAYDKMSNVLLPSYTFLPQHLKACFLYMGVFPPRCKIPALKLINFWCIEGFLEADSFRHLQNSAMEYLEELVSASVVLVHQRRSILDRQRSTYGIKTCNIQSVYWHLCNKEAGKEKFFHVINSYANGFTDGIKSQRRLCVHNNTLLGIEEVHNSMESISTVHSLLCTGPHHQYPVPICFGLRLLRILDALTIRFYKFPIEVLKLVHLRYLALTYSGKKIPASISKLWKLEYLIVRRYMSIINSSNASSYLPVEIWDMKQLKHLQVMGSDLPDPYHSHGIACLPDLLTLSDVSVHSCSKEILKRIPHLKKLGIQIELVPDHAVEPEPFWYFDRISHLHKLKSLKCVIVNPSFVALGPPCTASSINTTSFRRSRLRKLSLSGFGYPWEHMSIIAKLPWLKVLKLRSYAFKGSEWVIFEGEFPQLEHLLLEDTDLECWRAFDSNCDILPFLRRLIIMHCYKLKEIPLQMGRISNLRIELVDCPVISVKQVKCNVHSSWDE